MIVLFRDGKRRFFLVCRVIRMMSIDAVCVASRIGMLDRVFEIMRQFLQKAVTTGGIKVLKIFIGQISNLSKIWRCQRKNWERFQIAVEVRFRKLEVDVEFMFIPAKDDY